MRFPTHCLRKGTVLYHGTRAADMFEEGGFAPRAPAWFSTSRNVAENFVNWNEGRCPRILVYRATRSIPKLVSIEDQHAMQQLVEFIERQVGFDLTSSPADLADELCNIHFSGWYIPNNYPEGDDIMLCDTDALELVERICVE